MNRKVLTYVLGGVGVVMLLGVGSTVLASKALPGDTLYGFRLGVIEKISAAFAGGGRSKVEWQIAAAERRLSEASAASLKGQLDAEAQQQILINFNAQMQSIDAYITEAKADGRAEEAKEVAVRVGKALANQTESLMFAQSQAKEDTENTEDEGALDFLMLRVTRTLAAAANIAASTGIEDPAPPSEIDPSSVDEWGNPI